MRKHGEVGDLFIFQGMVYELTHVMRMTVHHVAHDCYSQEGFCSSEEFIVALNEIYPVRAITDETIVWAHCWKWLGQLGHIKMLRSDHALHQNP